MLSELPEDLGRAGRRWLGVAWLGGGDGSVPSSQHLRHSAAGWVARFSEVQAGDGRDLFPCGHVGRWKGSPLLPCRPHPHFRRHRQGMGLLGSGASREESSGRAQSPPWARAEEPPPCSPLSPVSATRLENQHGFVEADAGKVPSLLTSPQHLGVSGGAILPRKHPKAQAPCQEAGTKPADPVMDPCEKW